MPLALEVYFDVGQMIVVNAECSLGLAEIFHTRLPKKGLQRSETSQTFCEQYTIYDQLHPKGQVTCFLAVVNNLGDSTHQGVPGNVWKHL